MSTDTIEKTQSGEVEEQDGSLEKVACEVDEIIEGIHARLNIGSVMAEPERLFWVGRLEGLADVMHIIEKQTLKDELDVQIDEMAGSAEG